MPGNNREKKAQRWLEFLLPVMGVSLLTVLYFPRARHLLLELFLWLLALLALGLVGGTVLYVRHMKRLEKQDLPAVVPERKTPPSCPICGVGLSENAADPEPDSGIALQGFPCPIAFPARDQDQLELSDSARRPE